MMTSSELSSKLMSLAVRGYGLLAAPCRKYLSTSEVRHMFSEMMGRCEELFLRYAQRTASREKQIVVLVGLENCVRRISTI